MIYTVTLNPSVDYIVHLDDLHIGQLHIMKNCAKFPGGKGINVSRVLRELGATSTALGFIGGFTGQFIENWLLKEKIRTDFIKIQDDTRINIKLKTNLETEINAAGPNITTEEGQQLLKQIEKLKSDDLLILSGSKPPSLPEDYYLKIVKQISKTNASFVIDTSSKELLDTFEFSPLLVKPNKEELEEIFGTSMRTDADIIKAGKTLIELGAQHAIVSMGGEGAYLFTRQKIYRGYSPKGQVKNTVGAGDSMIAGFIKSFLDTKEVVASFKMGLATGSATAFSDDLATKEKIDQLLDAVKVEEIQEG